MTPRHPTTDPLPETLPEIEEEIEYWTFRLGEGEAGSNWEYWVDARLRKLQNSKERLLTSQQESQNRSKRRGQTGLVFLSCGQTTQAEKDLGNRVKELLEKHTGLEVYFAENQSSLRGLTDHILGALHRCVGFIGIMHHRGEVKVPEETFIRASVWIEQEIAIAAFIENLLGRKIQVQLFIQRGVKREGMRDKLLLNAVEFKADIEVIQHLEGSLAQWKRLESSILEDDTFDSTYLGRRERAKGEVFVWKHRVPSGSPPYRSETQFWLFFTPKRKLAVSLDEQTKRRFGALIQECFRGHSKLDRLDGATGKWADNTDHMQFTLRIPLQDQERQWRFYSSGELAFVTQVCWDVAGSESLWSLYDVAADLVYLVDAAQSLWGEQGFRGATRLAAELKVSGLQLHQSTQGFPALYYDLVTGLGDSLFLDSGSVTIDKQPRAHSFVDLEFDSALAAETKEMQIAEALNRVLRGLGHSGDLQRLRQTIRANFPPQQAPK